MFGRLNQQSITVTNSFVLCAFGSRYYLFSKLSQLCLAQIDIGHQSPVVASNIYIDQLNNKCVIQSLDSQGLYVKAIQALGTQTCSESNCKKITNNLISKRQKSSIRQASFLTQQTIAYIDSNNKINIFNISSNTFSHFQYENSFSRLINHRNQSYISFLALDLTIVSVVDKNQLKQIAVYKHSNNITAITLVDNTLVLGDERGKIILLHSYLTPTTNATKNNYKSMLQWHTNPVLSLTSLGQYIYSAGEQSVVVLWHLRDLSRDFLPRVGTTINSLSIINQSNEVICGLSDNSIKIIDISKDKQVISFKLMVNPKGYAPLDGPTFSTGLTHYENGILCLNSLPGKLQFLNIKKNCENTELEIVPRNLINSLDQDKIQPHRINCFDFSQKGQTIAISLLSCQSNSYLKFYHRSIQGYDLVCRIDNPHKGIAKKCLFVGTTKNYKFVSFSENDHIIRVWSEHRQKKRSLIDSTQTYWKCSGQLSFRNMLPTSLNCYKNFIVAVFGNSEVIVYKLEDNEQIKIEERISHISDLKDVFLLDTQNVKSKKNLKFLVAKENSVFELWNYSESKGSSALNITARVDPLQPVKNWFVSKGKKETLLYIQSQTKFNLLILNNKEGKFVDSFESQAKIESSFWLEDKLILMYPDLTVQSLDGENFIQFNRTQGALFEELAVSADFESTRAYDIDIFSANKRWVQRESVKNKKKIGELIEGVEVFPNCMMAWQEFSSKALL